MIALKATSVLIASIWAFPALAGAPAGVIVLTQVERSDSGDDGRRRYSVESKMQLVCQEEASDLNCLVLNKEVWRESPKVLIIWEYVTGDGQLTEKGKIAYREMRKSVCGRLESVDLEGKIPNAEYFDVAKVALVRLEAAKRKSKEMCDSETAAAQAWMDEISREAKTCTIKNQAPYETTFRKVGENKWVRSVGDDDLVTLSSGPMFSDGTGQAWTYIAEGTRVAGEEKPWKLIYKGTEETFPRGFELTSLNDCEQIYY